MAAVKNGVALELARRIVNSSSQLMDAINDIEEAYQWAVDSNINFNQYADEIEQNGEIQHADTRYLNHTAATVVHNMVEWLDTQTQQINGDTRKYREILQDVRR